LFTAIFISRLIFERMLEKDKSIIFSTKLTEGIFKNANIDFIGKRKGLYVFSAIWITIGLVSLGVRGLNMGVDFVGGRTYVIKFEQPVSTSEIGSALKAEFGESPLVRTFGADNQVKIETKYRIHDESPEVEQETNVRCFRYKRTIYRN
jgi:SecD/SecF fusion protein